MSIRLAKFLPQLEWNWFTEGAMKEKGKMEQRESVASMINAGARSTQKLVAKYTAALSKERPASTPPAVTQGQGDRKSAQQPRE